VRAGDRGGGERVPGGAAGGAAVNVLSTAEIARVRGWHRATAHRWMRVMQALGKKHGRAVVWRQGRTYVVDVAAAIQVAEVSAEDRLRQALNRIALLESAYTDQDARINGISRDLVEVRRQLNCARKARAA
jgi:hypothetical protein